MAGCEEMGGGIEPIRIEEIFWTNNELDEDFALLISSIFRKKNKIRFPQGGEWRSKAKLCKKKKHENFIIACFYFFVL